MFYELQDKTIQNISIEFRSHISMQEIENLDDYKEIIAPYIGPNIKVGAMRIFDSWMGMIKQEDLLEGMKIKNHKFLKSTPCARLDMLQVLSNGDTRICGCRWNHNKGIDEDIFNIGNAIEEDIIDMFNKEKVLVMRQSFITGEIPTECQLCSWYEG